MTNSKLDNNITEWSSLLKSDLLTHLSQVCDDNSVCGFAIELPSDFGNDTLISRVCKTDLQGDDFPSLDDWQYIPNAKTYAQSANGLETLYEKYSDELADETFYDRFGDRLYAAILSVLQGVVSTGNFSQIRVWLLTLSDDEHPILDEAALTLNDPSMQTLAQTLAH